MRVTFKAFDSKMASREKLFKAALDFVNKVPREDLINITHSEDRDNIVVTIWYYTDEVDRGAEIKARRGSDIGLTPLGAMDEPPVRATSPSGIVPPVPVSEPPPAVRASSPPPPVSAPTPAAPPPAKEINVTPGRKLSDQIRRIIRDAPGGKPPGTPE